MTTTKYKRIKDKRKRQHNRELIDQYNWNYENLGNLKRGIRRERIDGLQIQIIELSNKLDIPLSELSEEDLFLTILKIHYDWTDEQILKEVKRLSKKR
jgi:hypothetical protein